MNSALQGKRSAACLKPQRSRTRERLGKVRGDLLLRTRCGVGHSALVRPRGCLVEAAKVRFCAVKNRAVSNRNCVVETRGGEQRNENGQSVRVHRKRPYSSHLRALLHCHAFTSTLNGVCQTSTTKSVF